MIGRDIQHCGVPAERITGLGVRAWESGVGARLIKPDGMGVLAESPLRSFACALAIWCLLAAPGCVVVPMRVPAQTRDAFGKPLTLDLTFLKSGSSTRDEVTKNLAAIDTGVNQNNFFWGRWDASRWRSTAVGFVPPEGERIWRAQNLLIQFDQNGIVRNWVVVDDKKLDQQLDVFDPVAAESPLNLSSPLRANVRVPNRDEIEASFVLSSDFFEEDRVTPSNLSFSLKTPRTNLLRIAPTPGAVYYGPISGYVPYTAPNLVVVTVYLAKPAIVHLGEKEHSVGKKLALGLDPPTFLLLRRYIQQKRHESAAASARAAGTCAAGISRAVRAGQQSQLPAPSASRESPVPTAKRCPPRV